MLLYPFHLKFCGDYVVEILNRFGMLECKSMATQMASNLNLLCHTSSNIVDVLEYIQMIGLLMYLTHTRPYICFAVNTLSQYMVEPRRIHLIVEKHVMRYLKGTLDYGLRYVSDQKISLQGYVDSDWAR